MQFSEANSTIEQTNGCRPLQFSPAASAIPLSQQSNNPDAAAYGYPFDIDNIANNFELHHRSLYLRHSFMQERATPGAMHAFDSINHFFLIGQMIIPGSSYWNIGIGRAKGEVEQDEEALRTMEALGQNMAWLLKRINALPPLVEASFGQEHDGKGALDADSHRGATELVDHPLPSSGLAADLCEGREQGWRPTSPGSRH